MSRKAQSSASAGRPRDVEKGVAILDAGWELFLRHGIVATSIEAIARKAGVSKVTLYTHYSDKQALFEAAIHREMLRIEAAQKVHDGAAETAPIAEQLQQFGLGIIGFLTSPPAIDFYAVVAGELRRQPMLARAFYDLGPGRTRSNLIAILSAAMTRGELVDADAAHAADQLFGLWQGFMTYQISLGIDIDALQADVATRVQRGITAFMAIYAPRGEIKHSGG